VLLFIYGFFAIAKSNGNRVKRVLEERINPKDNLVDPDTTYNRRSTHMTLAQIEDEIRSLKPAERIELYKWLDHVVVADCRVDTSFCSRLGVDRALKIRRAIDQKMKITTRSVTTSTILNSSESTHSPLKQGAESRFAALGDRDF
jgi:hypothetical protein